MGFKKWGISISTAALSLGLMASVANAQTPINGQVKEMPIQVASEENLVTKTELIKKFKEIFPNKFDFLTNNDFHMSAGHYFPGDDTVRYDLSFYKKVQGKDVNGSVMFAGDNLNLESFHFNPANQADALFPAKVSEEEAKKKAEQFVKKFANGSQYKLNTTDINPYYYTNQVLTEPIRYAFTFSRVNNDVKVLDQSIHVTVLGNGEISEFYRTFNNQAVTFDDKTKLKAKEEVAKQIKENLNIDLQYQVIHNYQTEERNVQLVYSPTTQFNGVHALSGDWNTAKGFTKTLSTTNKIERISNSQLPPKHKDLTLEDAKKVANELLKVDNDEVKLTIHSVNEMTNYNGKEIYAIDYSYDYKNGGYGANLEIDKLTGEVLHYYNVKNDVLAQVNKNGNQTSISSEQALTKAIGYLKEWVPSYVYNYSKPLSEPIFEKDREVYNFTFPRIVNGILVSGDELSVSIASDGSLVNLYVNQQNFDEWPTTDHILSKEEALDHYKEAMDLELVYMKAGEEDKHYSLVYLPTYNKQDLSMLEAKKGEWISYFEKKDHLKVSHPTAEQELNYLIQNSILELKDIKSFDANAAVSKGEALSVLVKSLTYFYNWHTPEQIDSPQTFENIGPDHPYYHVIERAVSLGILDSSKSTFEADTKVSREELAVWYIRALGLEQAAKYENIYKVNVKDADEVTFKGYVALANALELITVQDGLFNPKKEVSYAEIAVSVIRLAHKAYESGVEIRY